MIITEQIHSFLVSIYRTNRASIGIPRTTFRTIVHKTPPFSVKDETGEKILVAVRDLLPEGHEASGQLAMMRERESRVGWLAHYMEKGQRLCRLACDACSSEEWALAVGELAMLTNRMYAAAIEKRTEKLWE